MQSQRLENYRKIAQLLLSQDRAYTHTEEGKGEAVKFRVPKERIEIRDLIHHEVCFDNELLDDFVLLKSDGSPSYNFACVVDDHEMAITHVIRGDDHLPNTPKQVALYRALGWEVPQFAHIPLILSDEEGGGRLSKRKGAEGIRHYRELGFTPEGLVNAMALLGFSPGANREFVTRSELVETFALEKIARKSARFDFDKMAWVNARHLKAMDLDELVQAARPYLLPLTTRMAGCTPSYVKRVVLLFKERIKTLGELADFAEFFFVDEPRVTPQAEEVVAGPQAKGVLKALAEALEKTEPFDEVTVERDARSLIEKMGVSGKDVIHPARAAITGQTVSPGLFEVMALLGRERTVARLRRAAGS